MNSFLSNAPTGHGVWDKKWLPNEITDFSIRESKSFVSLAITWRQVGHFGISTTELSSTPVKRTFCLSVLETSDSFEKLSCDTVLDLFLIGPDEGSSFCFGRSFIPLRSSLYAHFHSVFGCWDKIPALKQSEDFLTIDCLVESVPEILPICYFGYVRVEISTIKTLNHSLPSSLPASLIACLPLSLPSFSLSNTPHSVLLPSFLLFFLSSPSVPLFLTPSFISVLLPTFLPPSSVSL